MEEFEVKFINFNVDELKKKLSDVGAEFIGSFDYKRKNYDFPDYRLAKENAWVRVRDEGERVVMTYKQRQNVSENSTQDGGMKEIEIEVSDFHVADELLKSIGMIEKFYEENKRERYVLHGVEIDIDYWPLIPPYVEIEGSNWESVEKVSSILGFDWSSHLKCSAMQIYAMNGIDENSYSVLTFETQIKK